MDVIAANDNKIKKVDPIIIPVVPPKSSKIWGNTWKIKPGPPCVSMPDEKTKGNIISPARKAIPTSVNVMRVAQLIISLSSSI